MAKLQVPAVQHLDSALRHALSHLCWPALCDAQHRHKQGWYVI